MAEEKRKRYSTMNAQFSLKELMRDFLGQG